MGNKEFKIITDNDELFFDWLAKNPNGVVLNTRKNKSTSYYILHKSDCYHIATRLHWKSKGGYTEKSLIKVCALSIQPLITFVEERKQGKAYKIQNCKSCNPQNENLSFEPLAEELSNAKKYYEGSTKTIQINAFERNVKARNECIAEKGIKCSVCNMSFEEVYGKVGRGFIHVHHLKPISTLGKDYEVNPSSDLEPVCPNCHAMLHKGVKKPRTIEALKRIMSDVSKSNL